MDIGIVVPNYSSSSHVLSSRHLRRIVRSIVDAGFGHCSLLEHLTEPETYNTAWMDPISTASWIAGVAEELTIGTSILVAPIRNSTILASELLTLRHLSGHPLRLGIGTGYAPAEFAATATDRGMRASRTDQFLKILRRAATDGVIEVDADGAEMSEAIQVGPAPVDFGPILIGGGVRLGDDDSSTFPSRVLERIVRHDGWISSPRSTHQLSLDWSTITKGAGQKKLLHDHLNYVHIPPHGRSDAAMTDQERAFGWLYGPNRGMDYARRHCITGARDDIVTRFEQIEAIGVDTLIVNLVAPTAEEWLVQLRRLKELVPRGEV